MKTAVEGVYNSGKITLKENINLKGKANVLVVFLENIGDKNNKMQKLLSTFGSWEDDRDSEEIISNIYESGLFGRDDISL
jgi:predicted DNA-binding antitoxin AbrB/MazE fold protein